ncbi:MAG: asparagine synthase (glutamine-hydrolyzing) [Planctomycetota bacterium]
MCGIAGVFLADRRQRVEPEVIQRMADALRHRGPDGDGVHCGPGYGLGHRRLSIIDLSGGAQPMHDGSEQLWLTYNGEIYNYRELRQELEAAGYRFRTDSDTEVLLHGYREWGEELPRRLLGMFAFVVVDEREHVLFAARDRVGKKPFYYEWRDGSLAFASELKALRARGGSRPALDPAAVSRMLCLRYVPDPGTIYRDIAKLPPGHSLTCRDGRVDVQEYWRLSFATPSPHSDEQLQEEVRQLLDRAVRDRLISEVPLGAFLSGGLDSSAVVESMGRVLSDPVVACGIGFDDRRFDELGYARTAAEAYGAHLHEDVVRIGDMLELGWFADTFDEPFADSSAVPTYFVSRMARRHVTVALSGDGGDEAFAGYRRYRFDWLENGVRRCLPLGVWGFFGGMYPKADFLPRWLRAKRTLENLARDPAEAYARSVSACLPEEVLPLLRPEFAEAEPDPLGPVRRAYQTADGPDALSRAAAADFATWLPGDILTKVDRASMAVSLEVRAPFLDHRLLELAAGIPSAIKLRGHQTKGFLRRALADRIEPIATGRRKQGFEVPLRSWFAGPLGDALEKALNEDRLATVVDVAPVRRALERHRQGVKDHCHLLWGLSVLDRFLERWG